MEERSLFEETVDQAMNYMKDKYGEEFKPVCYDLADYLSRKDGVECVVDGMDPEKERIFISVEMENNVLVFHDSYAGTLLRSQMEKYIYEMIKDEFADGKVYCDNINTILSDELGRDSSIKDFYTEHPSYRICVKAYVRKGDISEDEFGDKIAKIENKLIESGHRFTICIRALENEEYEGVTRFDQKKYQEALNRELIDEQTNAYSYYATISNGEVRKYGRTE